MRQVNFTDGFSSETAPETASIIEDNSIDGTKILLNNNESLKADNFAGDAAVEILKVNVDGYIIKFKILWYDKMWSRYLHLIWFFNAKSRIPWYNSK